jgi:diaminohydroxyphosphoribosylaminopyrimidine deaminase/5-amino-6-(5-phosphoribosylamino)uracil reductase
VLDSRARTPPTARLVSGELPGRTLILVTEDAPPERRSALEATAAEVVAVPALARQVHPGVALRLLAEREVTTVLVEAGGTLVASLLEAGLVDKVYAFVAPKLVGGAAALTPVEGSGCPEMGQAITLQDLTVEQLGHDLLVTGYLPRPAEDDPGALAIATTAVS